MAHRDALQAALLEGGKKLSKANAIQNARAVAQWLDESLAGVLFGALRRSSPAFRGRSGPVAGGPERGKIAAISGVAVLTLVEGTPSTLESSCQRR